MQGETHLVIKGFDAVIYPSEEDGDNFEVILSETGNEVYQAVIPIPVDEDSDSAYSEDLIEYAAQAAVDLYEAGRDTLGEGAGTTMKESNKKRACTTMEWEDWYLQLKGTPYEEQATQLLEQLIEKTHATSDIDTQLSDLYEQEDVILKELDLLNLERLKSMKVNQTVIVINAKKAYLHDASDIQNYLDGFCNCGALEIQAIAKMQELLDVRSIIRDLNESSGDSYREKKDLQAEMEELMLQNIQQGALEAAPDMGMDAAPALAADIAELMEGVDLHSELEPMIAKKSFEEVEDNFREFGEQHEGLDPAEIPLDDQKYAEGDKVTFKEKFEDVGFGGVVNEVASGTSGVIDSLWDGHGDCVLVATDDGQLVKAPVSVLKS